MFTVEERDRVRNRVVQMSRADPRLVAGALVGSTAGGGGDQWSDLDLTFGLAVVYLLHAHACIARERMWEAEYCISAARDQALSLACLDRSLKTTYGRGFDDLPSDILKPVAGALVGSLQKTELIRALGKSVDVLLQIPKMFLSLSRDLDHNFVSSSRINKSDWKNGSTSMK